jgi:antitoxin component YwqK of YwqJK toxin-antitoxin module
MLIIKKKLFLLFASLFILSEAGAQIKIEYCDTAYYHNYRDETGQHCLIKRYIPQDGHYAALKNKNTVEEFYVKDQQVQGPYRYFKPGGLVMMEGFYSHGFKSGIWKSFNPANSSLPLSLLIYKEGKLEGKAVYYDPDKGALLFKGTYKKNKKAGKWKIYEKGKYIGKLKFNNGQVLESYKDTDLWKSYKWRLESNTH